MQSVASSAVYNALSNKANGSGGIYHKWMTPRQLNTNSEMISIISDYPVGSLVLFQVGWDEYTTFPYAGAMGFFMICGGSGYAFGEFRQYSENKFTCGFKCIDGPSNYSGIYTL